MTSEKEKLKQLQQFFSFRRVRVRLFYQDTEVVEIVILINALFFFVSTWSFSDLSAAAVAVCVSECTMTSVPEARLCF